MDWNLSSNSWLVWWKGSPENCRRATSFSDHNFQTPARQNLIRIFPYPFIPSWSQKNCCSSFLEVDLISPTPLGHADLRVPESFIFPSLPATSHPANMTKVAIWAPTICQVHDDLSALSWLILAPTQQSMRYLLHLEMRKLRLQGILCYSFPSSSNCKVTKLGLTSGSSASSTQNLTSTKAVNNSPPLPSQIPLKKFLFMCLLPHLSFSF